MKGTLVACGSAMEQSSDRYVELLVAILDRAVQDYKLGSVPFNYTGNVKWDHRAYGGKEYKRKYGEGERTYDDDGEEWADFKVDREEILEFVNGPDWDYYMSCIPIPIEVSRRRFLERLKD